MRRTPRGVWFGDDRHGALMDFAAVYLAHHDEALAEGARAFASSGPSGAAAVRDGDGAFAAKSATLRRLFQRALRGDWPDYEEEVRSATRHFANRGVEIDAWYAAAGALRRYLVPPLVLAYGAEPGRLAGAIAVMGDFIDRILLEAAGAYRDAADRALQSEREIATRRAEERAASEASLRLSELRFARLYESGILGILVCDLAGNIIEANDGFLAMIGYTRKELAAIRWSEMTPPEWRHLDDRAIDELKRTGSMRMWEKEYFRKDGSRLPILVGVAMLNETDCIAFILDITERRRLEELRTTSQELENQNRRIQEANRLKSEFLANMSHELRTPLNSIIGFAELLHDGEVKPDSPQHAEFVGDILASGRHLLQLINDVLDLAKVEAGKIEFHPERVALAGVVSEVIAILRGISASKGIRIEVDVDPTLVYATIDPGRFKQVLYNYLSNALKFTADGGRVVARVRPEGAGAFRLEVEDSGIGIAPADVGRLFVEFQQLSAGPAKRHQGTGLGLALTKRIVEAQGGSVGVRSVLGKGSVFFAVLPREMREERPSTPAPPAAQPRPGAASVLVVEDDNRDLTLITTTLVEAGYGVETATTGARAVSRCSEHKFDAITLDLLLPDMTGLDVLHRVREGVKNRETPVLVVSVVAEKGVVGGFSVHDYVCKPVSGREVVASLERAGVHAGRTNGVLVVDDDPASLKLMEAALTQLGYRVATRNDGESALAGLPSWPPDAIVLDLLMPGIDGFEFLARLRSIPEHRQTPVIVWTMKDLTSDDHRRLSASAQAVLMKGAPHARSLGDELHALLRRFEPAAARADVGAA